MFNAVYSLALHLSNNTVELTQKNKRNKHGHKHGKAAADQQEDWPRSPMEKKKDKVMAEISNVRNANKMVSKGNDWCVFQYDRSGDTKSNQKAVKFHRSEPNRPASSHKVLVSCRPACRRLPRIQNPCTYICSRSKWINLSKIKAKTNSLRKISKYRDIGPAERWHIRKIFRHVTVCLSLSPAPHYVSTAALSSKRTGEHSSPFSTTAWMLWPSQASGRKSTLTGNIYCKRNTWQRLPKDILVLFVINI